MMVDQELPLLLPITTPVVSLPWTTLPPPLPKPRVWPVFVAVAAMLPVMIAVWVLAFAVWTIVHGNTVRLSPQESQVRAQAAMAQPALLIPVLTLISFGTGGIALSGAWLSPLKPRRRLALQPGTAGWGSILLLILGTIAAALAAMALLQLLGIHANQGTSQLLSDMVKRASPAELGLMFVALSVFPAVCEELLFRGYVQTRLVARWGRFAGIGITALMFGLIHMDAVQTPDMILVGSYFGWTAYRTGSTRTSMLCHFTNNALAVGSAMFGLKTAAESQPPGNAALLGMVGVGLFVCGLCTWIVNHIAPGKVTVPMPVTVPVPGQGGSIETASVG